MDERTNQSVCVLIKLWYCILSLLKPKFSLLFLTSSMPSFLILKKYLSSCAGNRSARHLLQAGKPGRQLPTEGDPPAALALQRSALSIRVHLRFFD
jgi:hypothetical protein